jgi:hypothetical protein
MTRPQRPVSPEAQRAIAESLDESAEWAAKNGYESGAKEFEKRAADYRAATGQTTSGQQQASS